MKKISVHDYEIKNFNVLINKKEIHIDTYLPTPDRKGIISSVKVIFHGVLAYFFINMNTIIFSIEESSHEEILKKYKSIFKKGEEQAWPGAWHYSSCEEILPYLETKQLKAWEITTSYNREGFVIAEKIEYLKNNS